jgi:hypothetical protein
MRSCWQIEQIVKSNKNHDEFLSFLVLHFTHENIIFLYSLIIKTSHIICNLCIVTVSISFL